MVLEAREWDEGGGARGEEGRATGGGGGADGSYEAMFVVARGLNQVEEARQQLAYGLEPEAPLRQRQRAEPVELRLDAGIVRSREVAHQSSPARGGGPRREAAWWRGLSASKPR